MPKNRISAASDSGIVISADAPPLDRHIARLDVLRAVAILLVFCIHYLPSVVGQYELGWSHWWRNPASAQSSLLWLLYPFTLGWSGVSLFFVISGFCIHYSFLKHQNKAGSLGDFSRKFLLKRFWRIYPPYFCALVVCFILFIRHFEFNGPAALHLWLHALMIFNFSPRTFFSINPSFWSLAIEVQFYLLFPVVLYFRNKFGLKNVFWVFVAISLLCRISALYFQDWEKEPAPVVWDFTLILFVDWLLGALLAESYFSGKRLLNVAPKTVFIFGFLAFAFTLNKVAWSALGFTMFSVFYTMIMELYLFSARSCNKLEKSLVPIGLCSYSIYLWHQPLIGRFLNYLNKFGISETHTITLLLLPLVFIGIFVVGYISYRIIELPSIQVGRWLSSKLWR